MTTTTAPATVHWSRRLANALGKRELDRYPATVPRYFYLGLVVVITIVLYYLYYVEGAITPLLLPYYHMSFQYFLYLLVVSNAIGAFSAFIGGWSDRIGRANLAIYGTFVVGLMQLLVPHVHSRFDFAVVYCVIGFVEGIILVVTPALIRDFSPQMGRGAAMGFWALGPTMGSLTAALVASHTLPHLAPFQDQFVISGLVCMAVVLVAFAFLRELTPQLRDQLMVTERERALVEARAKGIDIEAATAHPWRSMMHLDLFASAFGISVLLLIYYASVSVLTIYWVVVFTRTTADANGINTWYWAADAVALVLFGVLSDRMRVRKPFMVVGALGGMAMTIAVIVQVDHPHASYYENVAVVVPLAIFLACAYTPWMAGYTEAVEARNPALVATGLSLWGWLLRIIVSISFLVLPHVITTSTTLVDYQSYATQLESFQAAQPYAPPTTAGAPTPLAAPADVLNPLRKAGPPGEALADVIAGYDRLHNSLRALAALPPTLQKQALGLIAFEPLASAIQHGKTVPGSQIARVRVDSPQLAALLRAEEKLIPAQEQSPAQWRHWWWVCFAGQFVFLVLVFTMRGPWSPRAARRALDDRERFVEQELERLRQQSQSAAGVPSAASRSSGGSPRV